MSDLFLERTFPQSQQKVFEFLTKPENLTKWFGPEGINVTGAENLDWSRKGPWGAVMTNAEGSTYKVTGEVTHVNPPDSIEFTWAWHDDKDERGHESRVRFDLHPDGDKTIFKISHIGLPDDESAKNHNEGWTSTLKKLERLAS